MSWVSNWIDQVLPGAPMQNLTENTIDKWIKPEDKDTIENVGTTAVLMGFGVPASVATSLSQYGQTGDSKYLTQAAASYAMSGGLNNLDIPGDAGKIIKSLGNMANKVGDFLSTELGQTLKQYYQKLGGDSGKLSGILEYFGITGGTKDVVEQALAIWGLAELGNELAKDDLNKAELMLDTQSNTLMNLISKSNELMPTEESKARETAQGLENVQKEYQRALEGTLSDLSKRNALRRGYGSGIAARMGDEEAQARLEARRDVENNQATKLANAIQVQSGLTGQLGQAGQYAMTAAQEKAILPLNVALEIYKANQQNKQNQTNLATATTTYGGNNSGFDLSTLFGGGSSSGTGNQVPTSDESTIGDYFPSTTAFAKSYDLSSLAKKAQRYK